MEERIFDNHQEYNKFLSIGGNRVNESGTEPSIYITCITIRKTIKEMTVQDMGEILRSKEKLSDVALDYHQKRLIAKLEILHDWQLLKALHVLMHVGRIECVEVIAKSRRSNKE